ncbi:MAG: glycine--tRNA ligase, partial [Myxococcota bacterium]
GLNGFWDYGPLGAQLKKNLKDAWWSDIIESDHQGPGGQRFEIVPVDCTIVMNPRVWEASGHVGGFNDPMVDCRATKSRYRADHLVVIRMTRDDRVALAAFMDGDEASEAQARKKAAKALGFRKKQEGDVERVALADIDKDGYGQIIGPDASEPGTLTEPRQFNLMFETYVGALRGDDDKAYLRPETAQGIFTQFWNVVDTSRVKVPFGIAQIGKAFRNEVTPRNFTFRSREFEQMEIEFFIHPSEAEAWYAYWRDTRFAWWQSIGLAGDNLILREHDRDELAHYAKQGAGTSDVEYRFPFTHPGHGELEGIAHRADYDLLQHATHCGKGEKMRYFDQERGERYFPHVIEPSAGADRGTLAVLCEAFTPTPDRKGSKYIMKFHPRLAPIKAGIFPLVAKDGMPEVADKLYADLRKTYRCQLDVKQSVGKRYARMDEAGTPYCFTIDGQTLDDQTVTVRDRDTASQERIGLDHVATYLAERIGG